MFHPVGLNVVNYIQSNVFVSNQVYILFLGIFATVLALSFGLHAMRTGNRRRSQLMMRARIIAQGFTLVSILGGVIIASRMKPTGPKS